MPDSALLQTCEHCIHSTTGNCPASSAFRGENLQRFGVRRYKCGDQISAAGTVPIATLLRDGWAVQHVQVSAHDRQILHFFVAGDLLDQDVVILADAPSLFTTRALTDATACLFCAEEYRALLAADPRSRHFVIQRAQQLQRRAAKRLVDVARRRAHARIASFVLEVRQRLMDNGVETDDLPFPFKQKDLADALGLTIAHVNRTLRAMADLFVIRHDTHTLRIFDLKAVEKVASQIAHDR